MGDIQRILDIMKDRAQDEELYRKYYLGDQRVRFATEKFKQAFGHFFRDFSDNLMPTVIDSLVDRLKVTGFDTGEAEDVDTDKIWRQNRMNLVSSKVYREALTVGCAYVLVWPNSKGVPTVYPQRTGLCAAIRSEDDPYLIEVSGKLWKSWDKETQKDILRLNVFYADHTERYWKRNADTSSIAEKQFEEWDGDGKGFSLPNPYGVNPMFLFENASLPGDMGMSGLKDAAPLQDVLNKTVLDTMVAMEYYGLPQRYATGIELEYDDRGQPLEPFIPQENRIWYAEDKDVKFGEFAQADIKKLLEVAENVRTEIARVTGTPLHYFLMAAGDFPSGESMKTAEARFIAKIENLQNEFGEVWENLMRLLLVMDSQVIADEDMLECTWTDAFPRSDDAQVKLLLAKKELGVLEDQLLIELGYTQEQIDAWAIAKKQKQQEAMDMAMQNFNAGGQEPLPFPQAG